MKIAVTSGKGGTGKTTVSTGLFQVFTKRRYKVQLVDCDVEEPNCHIFIQATETGRYAVDISLPEIDVENCSFCGECKKVCAFNAIVMLPAAGFIAVAEDMCHGCGACSYICPGGAIREKKEEIGQITHYTYKAGDTFIEGRMKVGKALQTRVIRETIHHAHDEGIVLFDSPPGTSCPVVATVSKADYVILVTEPTPFGLYDLKLMVETVRQLNKRYGIVVNKSGLNYQPLNNYIQQCGIPLIAEIPYSRELAAVYSRGELIAEANEKIARIFNEIADKIVVNISATSGSKTN
jgi:MinD superfamily P-loop ATPase